MSGVGVFDPALREKLLDVAGDVVARRLKATCPEFDDVRILNAACQLAAAVLDALQIEQMGRGWRLYPDDPDDERTATVFRFRLLETQP